MTHHRIALVALFLSLAACTAPPMPPISDAMTDAARVDDGPRTFTIELVSDDLVCARGDRITLDVRIVRTGGFSEPVLVELAGLPDPLHTQARESRPGDELTTLTIVTDVDAEDPIPRSAFVVQATTIDGLRQTAPAHVTVD
jgi:hypothetical protein